jgi:hypothetical protein
LKNYGYEEARASCATKLTPLLREAGDANATLDLFAPELAGLAAKIVHILIETEGNLGKVTSSNDRITENNGFTRVQRPVFNECQEMARQARVLSRLERRPLAEWITTRRLDR